MTSGCSGLGGTGVKWDVTARGYRVSFWGDDDNVLKLTVGVVAQFMTILQNHWNVPFKWVNCKVCELHLTKVVIKPY